MKYPILTLLLCITSLLALSQSNDFPAKPNPPRLVNDLADVLSQQEEAALEQKLKNYSDTTSTQIAVVTLTSIGGYDINQYGAELGEQWGIGTGKYDNGLIILVAKNERKVAIQTGYGLEEYVPDALAKRITERTLKPAFARGEFYQGLDKGTSLIIDLASGAYQADPSAMGGDEKSGGPSLFLIIIVVILVVILFSRRGGGGGGRGGRRGYSRTFGGPVIVPGGFGSFRSGGGMFGGGGGGGFGGFGGGSFGGGGASSSW